MKKLKIIEGWKDTMSHCRYCDRWRTNELECENDCTENNDTLLDLLQQQAELTRAETIKECIDVIEKYKLFAEDLHRGAHRDNLNMLLYDSSSRIVACDHILEKINLLTPKQDE